MTPDLMISFQIRKLKNVLPPARELNFQKHEVPQNVRKNDAKVFQEGTPRKGKTTLGPLYGSTVYPGRCS